MALSRDRGTANQAVDQGYGVVCDVEGRVLADLIVAAANQEHGIIALRPGSAATLPDLPIGTLLRILPNHACATAAQFDGYAVLPVDASQTVAYWSPLSRLVTAPTKEPDHAIHFRIRLCRAGKL